MGFLGSLFKSLFSVLIPWIFTKEKTVAENSIQAPDDERHGWAARINRRMQEFESEGGDSSPD